MVRAIQAAATSLGFLGGVLLQANAAAPGVTRTCTGMFSGRVLAPIGLSRDAGPCARAYLPDQEPNLTSKNPGKMLDKIAPFFQ